MNGPGAVQQPQQQVVVQQEEPPKKESKYGGLKQTVRVSFFLFSCFGFWVSSRWCFVFRVSCFVSISILGVKSGALMCCVLCWIGQLATSAVGGVGFGAGAFSVFVFRFRDCL